LTDFRRLLERKEIQMVDICLPTYLHAEIAIAAAEAGKHILCEKPIAHSLAAADAMIEAAAQNNVKLMIGQVRRFDHRYRSIKEELFPQKPGNGTPGVAEV
jgi:UDP-N-acetylglucosamine 3-dehydrogenase